MIDFPQQELSWLQRFFSGRNALKWEAIASRTAPDAWLEHVTPWISQLERFDDKHPIVLAVFDEQGPCTWYAAAHDKNSAAALAEDLMGSIGPSYSDFRGIPFDVSDDDPITLAFQERFGQYVFCFCAVPETARSLVTQALARYLRLLQRRPPTPDRTRQPFGKLRGDFDKALLVGNEAEASRLLEEMFETGRVDAEQRQYLEIRRLAGLGRVSEIAHNFTLIRSIADLPLPPQTLTDVVDALYTSYLTDTELKAEPASLVEAFHSAIGKPFGRLFQVRKGVRHPSVLKAFLLYELSQPQPSSIRCDAIVAAAANEDLSALLRKWMAPYFSKAVTQLVVDIITSAKQAIGDEDYAVAAELCFQALPDKWAYSALLRCAVELVNAQLTEKVLTAFDVTDESIRFGLNERDKARLGKLLAQRESLPCTKEDESWLSWCDAILAGTHGSLPLVILDKALVHWQVDDYVNDLERCKTIADRIGNANGQAEVIFREAYPQLVEFFAVRPGRPVRGFLPLYSILIKMIAWNGTASADELALTTEVAHALVSVGVIKDSYTEAVEDLGEILMANKAVTNLDWALNTAELLALHPAPEENVRLRFFMNVVDLVSANIHRVTTGQRMVLDLLAKDFHFSEPLPTLHKEEVQTQDLEGVAEFNGLIGVYTLTESAGQRAKQTLQKLLPQARIELNTDHAATERLHHLAANADIFVFAWKSSKHQAYYCAKEARGDRELQMPLGKGSASIIDSVFRELARIA